MGAGKGRVEIPCSEIEPTMVAGGLSSLRVLSYLGLGDVVIDMDKAGVTVREYGYLFLDWARPVTDRKTDIALVITGTGACDHVF